MTDLEVLADGRGWGESVYERVDGVYREIDHEMVLRSAYEHYKLVGSRARVDRLRCVRREGVAPLELASVGRQQAADAIWPFAGRPDPDVLVAFSFLGWTPLGERYSIRQRHMGVDCVRYDLQDTASGRWATAYVSWNGPLPLLVSAIVTGPGPQPAEPPTELRIVARNHAWRTGECGEIIYRTNDMRAVLKLVRPKGSVATPEIPVPSENPTGPESDAVGRPAQDAGAAE